MVPVAFSLVFGLSAANAAVVKVGMALDTSLTGTYAPPPAPARASGSAMPTNIEVPGRVSQPESVISPSAPESSGATRTTSEPASEQAPQGRAGSRKAPKGTTSAPIATTDSGAKGGMPPAAVEYAKPGALKWVVDGGWSSQHLWRGIDIIQFTSYNRLEGPLAFGATPQRVSNLPTANSDIAFLGVDAQWNGFDFGVKYIRSLDDDLNPYFCPTYRTTNYEEWVFTANYSRGLIADNWLVGTFGFDFYLYPEDEFWGVDHQGMLYVRLNCQRWKWAQPFLDLFYNVPTTSQGAGFADLNMQVIYGADPFRTGSGSDLVEGWGAEFGVRGGDQIATLGSVSFGISYSLSSIYKQGYAFEDDGLSHLVASLSFPIVINESFTISPAVTYVQALGGIETRNAAASNPWNEPDWSASVKLTYTF